MPGAVLHALHALWLRRERQDQYIGTLVNAWLEAGGVAVGVRAGESYVDVGTLQRLPRGDRPARRGQARRRPARPAASRPAARRSRRLGA